MHKQNWIIDTDAGIDDAQALFLGLRHWNVVAFTCVGGNTTVDNVVQNVAKVLYVSKKKVPIYRGCERPIVNPLKTICDIHGSDGFGNAVEY